MVDDWMDDGHRAAALSGFRSNPVAMAYARACAHSDETADQMLQRIKDHPRLLEPAPLHGQGAGAAIEHRRTRETHSCFRCGQRAELAYIVDTGPPYLFRWLDLCRGDALWMTCTMTEEPPAGGSSP